MILGRAASCTVADLQWLWRKWERLVQVLADYLIEQLQVGYAHICVNRFDLDRQPGLSWPISKTLWSIYPYSLIDQSWVEIY